MNGLTVPRLCVGRRGEDGILEDCHSQSSLVLSDRIGEVQ